MSAIMSTSHTLPAFLVLTSFAAIGCGAEAYQERLIKNALPLFQYKQELDAHLGAEWRKGEVRLRLPAEFKEIPAPKKDQPDRRLPPGFPEDLVGVLGGFRGSMSTINEEGDAVETPTYAMVLSNRALLASRDSDAKPSEYDRMLINIVSQVADSTSLSTRSFDPITVGKNEFAPRMRYDSVRVDAAGETAPMRYELYVRREAPLQVAVLFIVPQEAPRSGPLRNQIELSLQTLRIEPPGNPTAATSPAGSPPSSGSSPGS